MVIIKEDEFLYLFGCKKITGLTYTSAASKIFRKNNKIHRFYGPALKWFYGSKEWYYDDKYYGHSQHNCNQKQFTKKIIKQWLS